MKTLLTIILLVSPTFAHEGHDHDAPTALQAPKGGTIKSLEQTNVEVTFRGKNLKIYLYDKDLKPQNVKGYQLTAKAEHPRNKKTEDISLVAKETFYEAEYDGKGIHRYTLLLTVVDPKTGHNDKLSYTIEPKADSKK